MNHKLEVHIGRPIDGNDARKYPVALIEAGKTVNVTAIVSRTKCAQFDVPEELKRYFKERPLPQEGEVITVEHFSRL
jgi:hypothetical protein